MVAQKGAPMRENPRRPRLDPREKLRHPGFDPLKWLAALSPIAVAAITLIDHLLSHRR